CDGVRRPGASPPDGGAPGKRTGETEKVSPVTSILRDALSTHQVAFDRCGSNCRFARSAGELTGKSGAQRTDREDRRLSRAHALIGDHTAARVAEYRRRQERSVGLDADEREYAGACDLAR